MELWPLNNEQFNPPPPPQKKKRKKKKRTLVSEYRAICLAI